MMARFICVLLSGCILPSCNGFRAAPLTNQINTRTVLSGLSNVNDYFDSFKKNENNSDNNESKEPSQGSSYAQINDYFNSFNKPKPSEGDVSENGDEKWHGNDNFGLNTYGGSDTPKNAEFVPPSPPQPIRHMTFEEIVAYNNARLCPKMFLTQRAIQSFCYLLEECRDPHSGKWIEEFLNVKGLANYHGTGAFDIIKYPTWDSLLVDMIKQKNEKMIVSAKRRGRGHGGWSKNNPYLQERWVEFPIDIQPASLVQRFLPVREQLSREFERDLEIVQMVDGMIMESYFDRLRDEKSNSPTDTAFERISVNILSNFTEFQDSASSPFRKGNFDLLYSLCTQASTHCLLRELQSLSEDEVSYHWLKRFYAERVSDYFDGDQPFGRADDFIDALLRTPPSFMELEGSSHVGLVDPLRIAECIIAIRSDIAEDWKSKMREAKQDHLRMNDILIRSMLGKAFDISGDDVEGRIEIIEEKTWEALDDVGSFE